MYKITETQFDELPKELQDLYEKLPNHSREEVLECFPNTGPSKAGGRGKPLLLAEGEKDDSTIQERGGYNEPAGSAARFFYCAKASKKDRDEGLEGFEEKQQDESRIEGNPGGDNPRNRGVNKVRNFHPTVKPTELMRYLVKLVTPKGGTVLDPFTGSGSTGKACKLEGFNFIGVEREEEYVKIARARIEAVSYTPTLL